MRTLSDEISEASYEIMGDYSIMNLGMVKRNMNRLKKRIEKMQSWPSRQEMIDLINKYLGEHFA